MALIIQMLVDVPYHFLSRIRDLVLFIGVNLPMVITSLAEIFEKQFRQRLIPRASLHFLGKNAFSLDRISK